MINTLSTDFAVACCGRAKLGERPIVTARGVPPSILSLHLADDGDEAAAARSQGNRQNDVLGGFARGFHHAS